MQVGIQGLSGVPAPGGPASYVTSLTRVLASSQVASSILTMGDLMGAAEIGELLGVSRQRVQQLISRPDFPAPAVVLAMGKVWRTADVKDWARAHGRLGGS
jgi:predicted DNA-binding transcriptional regulator AlpA